MTAKIIIDILQIGTSNLLHSNLFYTSVSFITRSIDNYFTNIFFGIKHWYNYEIEEGILIKINFIKTKREKITIFN